MNREKRNRGSWIYFFRLTVAVALLVSVILWIGISSLIETFLKVRPFLGLITALCLFFLFLLGAFNIWLLLRAMQPLTFGKFIRSYIYCFAVSLFAPGQLGDVTLTLFLKRQGIPLSRGGVAYLLDKAITICILFLVGWYGAGLLLPEINSVWFLVLPVIGIIFFLSFVSLVRFIPVKSPYLEKLQQWISGAINELRVFRRKWYLIVLNISLTIGKWLMLSACYFVAFLSFREWIEWPAIGVIPVLSTLVGYIPVSLGGMGTVEISAIYLFSLKGIEKPTVLGVYLFLRLLQYFLAGVILIIINLTVKQFSNQHTVKPHEDSMNMKNSYVSILGHVE